MEREEQGQTTVDSQYIQQHLANERTFLAWVRTSITIVGLGFLAAGVVFRATPYTHLGHDLAAVVGIGSVVLGILVSAFAMQEYLNKRKGINAQTFRASKGVVCFVFVSLAMIDMFLVVLVMILLME